MAVGLVAAVSVMSSSVPVLAQGDDPGALFKQAVTLFSAQDYRAAIDTFREVFVLDPNPFVLYNIGRCYQELDEVEEAAKFYDWALDLGGLPEDARVEAVRRLDLLTERLRQRTVWRHERDQGTELVAKAMFAALTAAREAAQATESLLESKNPQILEPVSAPPDRVGPGVGPIFWVGVTTLSVGLVGLGAGSFYAFNASDDLAAQQTLVADYEVLGTQALVHRDQGKADRAIGLSTEVNHLADQISDEQRWASVLLTTGGSLVAVGGVLIAYDLWFTDRSCTSCGPRVQISPQLDGVVLSTQF